MAIPPNLRAAVVKRAQSKCEYCLKPEDQDDDQDTTFFSHDPYEIDHIIAEKHGGPTELPNLAYACFGCNRHKGSDIASRDPETGALVPLFNPRKDIWQDHFRLTVDGTILLLTPEGRVTARLLQFNTPIQVQIRADLIALGKLSPFVES